MHRSDLNPGRSQALDCSSVGSMRNHRPEMVPAKEFGMPENPPILLNLNGYTPVPAGKLVSVVTYLEMHEPAGAIGSRAWRIGTPSPRRRSRPVPQAVRPYRRSMVMVRSSCPERRDRPRHSVPRRMSNRTRWSKTASDIGLLELDFRAGDVTELAYFGLVPGTTGKGIGRVLMEEAIRRAFRPPVKRFFVKTCSLDHPGAVSFYMRSGFQRLQAGDRDCRMIPVSLAFCR